MDQQVTQNRRKSVIGAPWDDFFAVLDDFLRCRKIVFFYVVLGRQQIIKQLGIRKK